MDIKTPKYYRARIKAFTESNGSASIDENNKFFRNGFVPKNAQSLIDKRIKHFISDVNNNPLSFAEITSYSTWFAMHPEKMAGVESESTSRAFPVKLKGNKKDIENMFASVFSAKVSDESEVEALALALQIELELMELDGLSGVQTKEIKLKNVYNDISKKEIPKICETYYSKNIQKKKVVNLDTGYLISFTKQGKTKTTRGRHKNKKSKPIDKVLATIINNIIIVMEYAILSDKNRKLKPKHIKIGGVEWLNFYTKVIVDNKRYLISVPVLQIDKGKTKYKFQYSVDYANVKKILMGKRTIKKSTP